MQVTFFNELANRRGVVVDKVTDEQAQAIAAKVSDPKQPYFYLKDVRVEKDSALQKVAA